jgi:hypothetical protein
VHVLTEHPEMAPHLDETLTTVHRPDAITPDPIQLRWRYWRAGSSPSRWLFVVVDWRNALPEVVTAFGKRKVRIR